MNAIEHRKVYHKSSLSRTTVGIHYTVFFHRTLMTVMEAMRRQGRHRELDQRSPRCIGGVLPCLSLSIDDYCTNCKRNNKSTARTTGIPVARTTLPHGRCPGRKAGRRVDHFHVVVVWVSPRSANPLWATAHHETTRWFAERYNIATTQSTVPNKDGVAWPLLLL